MIIIIHYYISIYLCLLLYLKYDVIFDEVDPMFENLSNTNNIQKSKTFVL